MSRVRTHANPLSFREKIAPIEFKDVFKDASQPLDIEIGFGRGVFVRQYAKQNPTRNLLGIEVRGQIVTDLQAQVDELALDNVHLVHGTAEECFKQAIPDCLIARVFIFHPDPWFKKKHHKRRVIRPEFVEVLSKKLKPGAELFISTDVTDLFDAMLETLAENGAFKQTPEHDFWQHYTTHWDTFSQRQGRVLNKATFRFES